MARSDLGDSAGAGRASEAARKARVSVSTVRRALRELEELGEVRQVAPGDFGTASDRQSASDWVLAKVPCVQADHVFRVNTQLY